MEKFFKTCNWLKGTIVFLSLCLTSIYAQSGINEFGSFEQDLPSFWTKGSEPGGSTLTWASDDYLSMGRSLKIEKNASDQAAMWESENMVDLWSDRHFKDVDIKLGVSYKTEGVNTNPTTDDEKWYVSYTFYREDGSEIGEKKFELDQSASSTSGWIEDSTSIGEVILPEDSYTTIIRFVGGKDAVGTVWTDNYVFVGREGGWAGQNWNTHLGVPTGWFYWLPPIGGNDGELTAGYENTVITDETSYHGNYSLKFDMLEGTRDGFVGTKRFGLSEVVPGDKIRISVWLKGENLEPDSAAVVGDQWSVAITPIFHETLGNNEGWGEIWSSDIPLVFPKTSSFDWTQFYVDVPVVEGAKSLSVRIHPLGRFQGTVYADVLTVEKLDVPEISEIGSFEQDLPSFWTKGSEPGGSTLTWASDDYLSMGRSLKIEKNASDQAAMWESENMVDLWSDRHFKDVDIKLGVSYKTEGVNTNPTTDDEKWYVSYTFYREDGSEIGEKKFELDQSASSTSGWIEDSTSIGEVILPEDSYTTIIRFVGGKDAVGTVWTDNYVFVGREGGWAGQNWNTHLGVPTGWFYWLPPIGGNDGELTAGYENTVITDETSYHGNYSLKFDMLEGTRDGFVGTKRYALGESSVSGKVSNDITSLNNVSAGDVLRVSVWLKGENLEPDSAAVVGDQWSVAITPIFHETLGNNEGWGEIWSSDIPLVFPKTSSFDWTQFYVDVPVVEGAKSLSVRIHPLGRFQGTVYADVLTVEKLDVPEISEIGSFEQDLPSFWTKGSEPGGSTLTWASDDYLSMGRSLKIEKNASDQAAMWESENMVDLWSDRHFKDVDIKLGVSYKTEGVNTNPTTDDEKWYVSYTFYREDGSEIGEKKFELDQSASSTSGWIEDSTSIGEVILPEDSYTTIIRFVGGKDAVGTVWTDNYVFVGREGGWAGQNWNTHLGVPTGWFYWLPPIGGNDGELTAGYENTVITDETSYHGNYSLKFDMLEGTRDGFVGTKRYALGESSVSGKVSNDITSLNNVSAGDVLRVSVWLKGENLEPDSAAVVGDQWSVAITPIFHETLGNNEGWGEIWSSDIPLVFPKTSSFDWTQFYVDVPVVEGAKSLSVRIHPLGRFQGTVYADVLEVKKISEVTDVEDNEFLPVDYSLFQNYPNPFNPTTVISYAIPENTNVTVKVYDMLGREVKTLIDDYRNAGVHDVVWNGDNKYGNKVSSGTYIYTIKAGKFFQAKKMIMLK